LKYTDLPSAIKAEYTNRLYIKQMHGPPKYETENRETVESG